MTIVVLLILAVIWAAVLVPPMLRARAEGRPADSIGNFRRQLTVLQRTAPGLVMPAHSLRAPVAPRLMGPMGVGGTGAMGRAGAMASSMGASMASMRAGRRPLSGDAARRARTLKRRRDVLFGLLGAMGGSLLLGFLPSLRVLWGLHLVLDAAFVGYVTLLVRMRNMAAEREMELRFIPASARPEPALLLQRTAR